MSKLSWWLNSLWLALLALGVGLAVQPTQTLVIREAASGEQRFCGLIAPGETVAYLSRNSIYGVPVTETWQVGDNVIHVVEVVSAARVLDYYGIADYRIETDGQARGNPQLQYPDLRMQLTTQGQQRLQLGSQTLDLATIVPESTLIITPKTTPRWQACRYIQGS